MNNGNSSKQVLLSVLGIAVLVIAVVGVSFAFFTYSKTGENQLLTTGTIFFQFTDGDSIKLINQFPISDEQGAGFHTQGEGDPDPSAVANSVMTFQVVGHDSSGKGIEYTITAVPGDEPAPETIGKEENVKRTPLRDDEVKIYIKQADTENGLDGADFKPVFGDGTEGSLSQSKTYKLVSEGLSSYEEDSVSDGNAALKAGVLLGTGHITATSKDAQQTDKYEVRMWISDDVVIQDKTDGTGTKADGANYSTKDFAKKYYAVKIKIDAKTTPTVTP